MMRGTTFVTIVMEGIISDTSKESNFPPLSMHRLITTVHDGLTLFLRCPVTSGQHLPCESSILLPSCRILLLLSSIDCQSAFLVPLSLWRIVREMFSKCNRDTSKVHH